MTPIVEAYRARARGIAPLVDTYAPAAPTGASVVLVHGGGFVIGSRRMKPMRFLATQLAAAGITVCSVDYRMIRSGAGAEFSLTDAIRLGLDASWLNVLSVGDIGKWFPRASAGGLEAALFATYRLTPAMYMRAAATYQRTFFDFNSQPGDKNIAGGATDQYLALSLGAGVAL